jgi:hypothetical protein
MSLTPESFDFLSNLSTLWSVILGALLATAGGLAGGQLEYFLEGRRRERDSALFFAEVLSTLKIILDLATNARRVGDPYGPITMRMLRSARREVDLYERNRETLYAIRKGDLRARVHTIVLRLSMPLDGLFDAENALGTIATQLKVPNLPDSEREELGKRRDSINQTRDTSFEFMVETLAQMKPIVEELGTISGQDFESFERAVRNS